MFRKTKKMIGTVLALIMLFGMSTTAAFASEDNYDLPRLSNISENGMTFTSIGNADEQHMNVGGANPNLWPGSGPAPQVTSIVLYDAGWLENGNFGVIIQVYGYGSDTTTFDGRSISWIEQEPFILSGTGADGFYYLYDCGPITEARSYTFATTFRSTNFPYSQRSFSEVFTFSEN